MRALKKHIALALCLSLLFGCFSVFAFAEDSNITYVGDAEKFIIVPDSTDLFPNFKDVMPGDTLTQKITVNNDADNKVKVKIYIRSLGAADESYVEFLNQLHLTVQKAEDTPMFDAAADKTDGLTEWTYLGTLYSGGKVDLNATLEVPVTMDDRFQKDYGEIKWEFAVEELPVSPDDPHHPIIIDGEKDSDSEEEWFSPLTGGEPAVKIWVALLGISAVGIIAFSRDKRQKDKERVEF